MRLSLTAMSLVLLSLSACAPTTRVQTETMMETHLKTVSQQQRAAMFARIESEAAGISTGMGTPNKALEIADFSGFGPKGDYFSAVPWRLQEQAGAVMKGFGTRPD